MQAFQDANFGPTPPTKRQGWLHFHRFLKRPNGGIASDLEARCAELLSAADVLAHATQVGHDVVITHDVNDTVTLVGVHLNQLTAHDFVIV